MRKKISVNQLRTGMFVDGLDVQWLKQSFLDHQFLIKNEQQIKTIKNLGVSHVFIDPNKGVVDIPEEAAPEEARDRKIIDDIQIKQDVKAEVPPVETLSGAEKEVVEAKEYVYKKNNLLQIAKNTLLEGSAIDFTLYMKKGMMIKPLAEYENREIVITDDFLSQEGELLISNEDMPKYKAYLREVANYSASDTSMSKEALIIVKNTIIKENSKIVVKELLEDPRSGGKIKECKTAVQDMIDNILNNNGIMTNLLTINKHDYYTYTHSVEVCMLSVGMAIALGYKDRELFSMGIGTLLHDIGKSDIPTEIINKPAKLTTEEFSIMKQHVSKGFDMLKFHKEVPDDSIFPVLEHHEKISGTGYPFGIKGEDIHHAGMIAAIADVYDALTTERPYKKAMNPYKALKIIRGEGEDFDKDIFKEFVKMLGTAVLSQE